MSFKVRDRMRELSVPLLSKYTRSSNNRNNKPQHKKTTKPFKELPKDLREVLHTILKDETPKLWRLLQRGKVDLDARFRWSQNYDPDDLIGLLHVAATRSRVDMVRLFIQFGVNVNMKTGSRRETALHFAARHAHANHDLTILDALVNAGVEINAQDEVEGRTALHVACKNGQHGFATKLLSYHADCTLTDKKGKTAEDLAALKKCDQTVEAIKSKKSQQGFEEMSKTIDQFGLKLKECLYFHSNPNLCTGDALTLKTDRSSACSTLTRQSSHAAATVSTNRRSSVNKWKSLSHLGAGAVELSIEEPDDDVSDDKVLSSTPQKNDVIDDDEGVCNDSAGYDSFCSQRKRVSTISSWHTDMTSASTFSLHSMQLDPTAPGTHVHPIRLCNKIILKA